MERIRVQTLIGLAMVGIGLLQAGLYAAQAEWIATIFGLFFAVLGIGYLWAETNMMLPLVERTTGR